MNELLKEFFHAAIKSISSYTFHHPPIGLEDITIEIGHGIITESWRENRNHDGIILSIFKKDIMDMSITMWKTRNIPMLQRYHIRFFKQDDEGDDEYASVNVFREMIPDMYAALRTSLNYVDRYMCESRGISEKTFKRIIRYITLKLA